MIMRGAATQRKRFETPQAGHQNSPKAYPQRR